MNEPAMHRALLKHRQVMAASMAARSRSLPSASWYSVGVMLGLCLAIWLGHLMVFWLVQQLPFAWMFALGTTLAIVIPAFLAFVTVALAGSLYSAVSRRAYLRHFKRLDIPLEIEATYQIRSEGLRLTTERIEIFPRWKAIDTIECGKDGWVVSADQLTFLIPYADFDSNGTQRAFIAALIAHLSEPARRRSADAVAFVDS